MNCIYKQIISGLVCAEKISNEKKSASEYYILLFLSPIYIGGNLIAVFIHALARIYNIRGAVIGEMSLIAIVIYSILNCLYVKKSELIYEISEEIKDYTVEQLKHCRNKTLFLLLFMAFMPILVLIVLSILDNFI